MPLPTRQQLEAARRLYQMMNGWRTAYDLIRCYCCQYPGNAHRFVVLNKVLLINGLYGTRILAVNHLASNIARRHRTLRRLLFDGDSGAVALVAGCGRRQEYSFATKFAHFHEPTRFPMWDSQVQRALKEHGLVPEAQEDLATRYEGFRTRVQEILSQYPGLSFHEADQYLWLKGYKLQNEHPAGGEIAWAVHRYRRLWDRL